MHQSKSLYADYTPWLVRTVCVDKIRGFSAVMEYDNSALYDLVQLYEGRVVRSKAEGAGSWWNRKKKHRWRKELQAPTEWAVWWAPQSVWTVFRREKWRLPLPGIESRFFGRPLRSHYIDNAIPVPRLTAALYVAWARTEQIPVYNYVHCTHFTHRTWYKDFIHIQNKILSQTATAIAQFFNASLTHFNIDHRFLV